MPTTLRLLILEDEPNDVELEIAAIEEAGYSCQWERVETREDFLARLDAADYDLILSDYKLPSFDGVTALKLVLERKTGIPFILISGTMGEEAAIESLKAGATDYVLKNRLSRLAPVVQRALKEKAEYRQRQRAEEALRAEMDKLRSVFTAMKDGAYVVDQDYNIKFANPVLVAEFGPFEGRKCYAYFHDREDVCPWCQNPEVFAGKTVQWEWTSLKNGKTYDLLDTPLRNADGSIYKLEIFRDTTERKRAQEELTKAKDAAEAANRAKSEFLATMSHEIRTPLTAVIGFADLLIAKDRPRAEGLEHLHTIRRNAEHLLNIISAILDLSKIEAEKVDLELDDCQVRQIAEEVASLLWASANQKHLKLEVEFVDPLPTVIRTDPGRLRQILLNLAGNAIKFTDSGGVRITVSYHPGKDARSCMQFEVADTGIGMTAEGIGRLFRPFTQMDMSHTRQFGGTGLGLAISQKLAGMLGGQIEVCSEPSKGSTFTLSIDADPVEPTKETLEAPLPEEKQPTTADRWQTLCGRVLLVEDDPDMVHLMTLFLRSVTGIDIDVAENGRIGHEKALASEAEGKPYDLIFMDIRMPVMGGHEATQLLRGDGWEGPIVALTAHAMAGDQEKCLDEGCNEYLSKPANQDELLPILARYLNRTPAAEDQHPRRKQPAAKSSESALFDGLLDGDTMAELVEEFVGELPDKVQAIENAFRARNFQLLTELVHKLKGVAGMYGFPQVSEVALRVKHCASEGDDLEQLRARVCELTSLCREATEANRKKSAKPLEEPTDASRLGGKHDI